LWLHVPELHINPVNVVELLLPAFKNGINHGKLPLWLTTSGGACNKTLRHEALQLLPRLDSAIRACARAGRSTLRD
jgi:hypothetical protein